MAKGPGHDHAYMHHGSPVLLYLGGIYIAMAEGLPAGIAALIAGLQPVLTAIISHIALKNKLTTRQWLGVAIGFGAILLIVDLSTGGASGPAVYAWAILGTLSITVGAIFQKRFCADVPMASSLTLQFGAALLALAVIVLAFGSLSADWSGELVFAYFWLIFVTSFGSYSLIYLLIRRGQVMNFASLFYFTPGATMIIAYLVYGEQISQRGYLGLILAIFSIYLINGKVIRQVGGQLKPASPDKSG